MLLRAGDFLKKKGENFLHVGPYARQKYNKIGQKPNWMSALWIREVSI